MVTTLFKYGALATAAHYVGMTVAKPIYKAYGRKMGMNPYVKRCSDATFGRLAENIDYYGRNRGIERLVSKLEKAVDSDSFSTILEEEANVTSGQKKKIKNLVAEALMLRRLGHGSLKEGQPIKNFENAKPRLKELAIQKGIGRKWITSTIKNGFETVFWTMPDALADKTERVFKGLYSRITGAKASSAIS